LRALKRRGEQGKSLFFERDWRRGTLGKAKRQKKTLLSRRGLPFKEATLEGRGKNNLGTKKGARKKKQGGGKSTYFSGLGRR